MAVPDFIRFTVQVAALVDLGIHILAIKDMAGRQSGSRNELISQATEQSY